MSCLITTPAETREPGEDPSCSAARSLALAFGIVLWMGAVVGVEGQPATSGEVRVWVVDRGLLRVAFPSADAVDAALVDRLEVAFGAAIAAESTLQLGPPLPVSINLVSGLPEGTVGRAETRSRTIMVPLYGVRDWPLQRLVRVVTHEYAHIRLAALTHHGTVPAWFGEGFAEWVSSSESCDGLSRAEYLLAVMPEAPETTLHWVDGRRRERVWYDMALLLTGELVVAEAAFAGLLRGIQEGGFALAFESAYGESLIGWASQVDWQAVVRKLQRTAACMD